MITQSAFVNTEEPADYRIGGWSLDVVAECSACVSTLLSEGCAPWERFIFIEDLSQYRVELNGHGVELARRKHRLELKLADGDNLRGRWSFRDIIVSDWVIPPECGPGEAFISRSVMWRFDSRGAEFGPREPIQLFTKGS
jgi:hypothetical protein